MKVPGQGSEHDSYRSELVGLFGMVVTVKIIISLGNISKRGIEIRYDGLSALNRSFWYRDEDISSSQPHFDILSGLHGLKREIDTVWTYRYIAGHQEDVEALY